MSSSLLKHCLLLKSVGAYFQAFATMQCLSVCHQCCVGLGQPGEGAREVRKGKSLIIRFPELQFFEITCYMLVNLMLWPWQGPFEEEHFQIHLDFSAPGFVRERAMLPELCLVKQVW